MGRKPRGGLSCTRRDLWPCPATSEDGDAGNWGAHLLCCYLAVFLNFDITNFFVPAWVYLLVAFVGLLVPLLAAAHPVWKGTGITVHQALADFGVPQDSFRANAASMAKGLSPERFIEVENEEGEL